MTLPTLRDAGDSMVLAEFEAAIDPAVNARAIGLADAIRARGLPGVRDVRATFRSVAVDYDPLALDRDGLVSTIDTCAQGAGPVLIDSRRVEVPVVYGGESGPDLEDVARRSNLSAARVVGRHAEPDYHVFMLGFMPGFAYLGPVPDDIVSVRHDTPRLRVPGGSVGVAGRQTGVYPRTGPGGWALIGRTDRMFFDPQAVPACPVRPGDRVAFVPVERLAPERSLAARQDVSPARVVATVVHPGLLTTVQDLGRRGCQGQGVTVGGAMDTRAFRVANAAVGNAADCAGLEATLAGLDLRFECECVVAVAGGDMRAELDGRPVPSGEPCTARAGTHLVLRERLAGARAYIAVAGGLDVPVVLGSRATDLGAGFGGYHGRALRAGDGLTVRRDASAGTEAPEVVAALRASTGKASASLAHAILRVLPGPHDEWFESDALDRLQRERFRVTAQSNRVGYRLSADAGLMRRDAGEMISEATVAGAIQVPPDGQPILLMADRQVTGGYPMLASVIAADLPRAAQVAPGDHVSFVVCSRAEALTALRGMEGR